VSNPPGPRGTSHRDAIAALGLSEPAASALARYLALLESWSRRINLTGAASAAQRVALLVAPVLPLADLLEPGELLDVGSGNGSPGLVLALLRPRLDVTLLEPRQRRWAFLREAARAAGRPEVRVLRTRHDRHPGPPVRNLTLRALALPLRELAGLVVPGGQVLALGGRPRAEPPFVLEREHEPRLPKGGLPIAVYRRS
jgi:16S rRNA (guanine527-N7)-methyltransferase